MPKLRTDWDCYFLKIAAMVSDRSTCSRRKVGALAVLNKRILATGYNGAPSGAKHCVDVGCLREQLGIPSGQRHEICRGIHAEQNVIIQAAVHGVSLAGSTLYCTTLPCSLCSKMLVNCGIKRVIYNESYDDELTSRVFEEGGVELLKIHV